MGDSARFKVIRAVIDRWLSDERGADYDDLAHAIEQSESPAPRVTHALSDDALLSVLHEADGLLSLVGWRYASKVGQDLADELKAASARCRTLVGKIDGRI